VSSHICYTIGLSFLAHSKNELIQWRGVRRLSICKLLRKSLLLAGKWLDRHQTFTRWTPGQRASRVCSRSRSRSRDTGTFVLVPKSLLLPGKWLDHDQTCTRWSPCIQGVLKVKVKVKGHVIRELSWILGMSYSVTDGLVTGPIFCQSLRIKC